MDLILITTIVTIAFVVLFDYRDLSYPCSNSDAWRYDC